MLLRPSLDQVLPVQDHAPANRFSLDKRVRKKRLQKGLKREFKRESEKKEKMR